MNSIRFTCTALQGTGKQGVLPKDASGYYTLPVGGLNIFNSAGHYYPYEPVKELFANSAPLMRRISTGCLKGEMGHPEKLPGQSDDEFINRVLSVKEKTTCAHFESIWLDFDNIKDASGRAVVAIMAKVAPSGPMGMALERSLNNPKEDVCFSIRAFTEDVNIGGVKHRNLREIVTWDYVTEPGINIARKYTSPALEARNECAFAPESVIKALASTQEGVAMESTQQAGLRLVRAFGLDIDTKNKPPYFRW